MTAATTTAKPAAGSGGGRRYALLLALWDSEYASKVYGGYYNVFVAAFGGGAAGEEGGERWDCFRVIAGEFPAPEDLASYDGFVVSGSPHDAYGEEPWIARLCALIRTLHAMEKRVLGICFGHQVLCRALGGRIGKARNGWDVGVKKVTFARDLKGFEFLGGLEELPSSASLIEVHQDEVWELPPAATVLAFSEKTRVEAFAVGEHALGIQGHPEYTADILHNLIDRLTGQSAIPASVGEEARWTVAETGGPDRAFWTALCKGFLNGGRRSCSSPAPEVTSRAIVAGCFTAGAAPMVQLACSAGTGQLARAFSLHDW
ncbi:putative glutamine amidotransferase-like protein C13C5.04 [Panicum miliaceum]|uniref:Glutamine amidotransferase-like protein C13C5.04 n=1 Tax=Panicum miliaceum TaxID=4540 RepID=A0A3L6RSY1_PANMI|nr:putative glutamine amidotransferase-like protein C13C5.04 [Panicum miliaceum]